MCNANTLKPALMASLAKSASALKAADKEHNLKDIALGVGPTLAAATYASYADSSDRHFKQAAYDYERFLKEEATKELKMDLMHVKTQPTAAELAKKVAEYSAFPDVKKQAFAAAFPEGITEKNKRLAAAVFDDAEPIPQIPQGELAKYHQLNEGKGVKKAETKRMSADAAVSATVLAKLPPDMAGIKDMEGAQKDAWRYSLSNAAASAMVREGLPLDLKGGEATTRKIEEYMTHKDVQKEAYRNAYDMTNTGQARIVDKAPRTLSAAIFTDTPRGPAGEAMKAPSAAPEKTTAVTPASQDGANTAAPLKPGTPEFEQEKNRRLSYWKQKATDQLSIPTGAPK